MPINTDRIVALDLSLSNTGLAILYPDGIIESYTLTTSPVDSFNFRANEIADWVAGMTPCLQDDIIVREDYAYGSRGIADVRLKELGGIISNMVYQDNATLHSMPISSWKKFVTGKGNATKKEVQKALKKQYGDACKGWSEHEFDAVGVALTTKALLEVSYKSVEHDYQEEVIGALRDKANSLAILGM